MSDIPDGEALPPSDELHEAWQSYGKRSGLLDENGFAPNSYRAQTAYFAYSAAWSARAVLAAPQNTLGDVAQAQGYAPAAPSSDARDAARYRWLRARLYGADFAYGELRESVITFTWPEHASIGADLDASIDDAMNEAGN